MQMRLTNKVLETKGENIDVYTITPENRICFDCKRKKCNGGCDDLRNYMKSLREKKEV